MTRHAIRRTSIGAGILALLLSGLSVTLTPPASAVSPHDPTVLGTTPDVAAGSCWEIKQLRPTVPDGTYWLLTPSMSEPGQFYCDMTTDGGGWVLVGKGRNAWTTDYEGTGSRSALHTPAFAGGSDTHQLPSPVIDQLLDGGRVADLAEGVRVRRARTTDGSLWQEVRLRLSVRDRWAWTFGGGHPMTGYSFDGLGRSGGTSSNFGIDSGFLRMTTRASGWKFGFRYGSWITGTSASESHLYSLDGAGGAFPVSHVYLRPRVTSDDADFVAIPDSGTGLVEGQTMPESTADALGWGVSGLAGSTSREGNVEVQAFTQSGNRVYVGGNFRYVQRDGAGTGRVEQSFLAAFDVDSGEWVSSFRPVLDEQVRALATLPDGTVLVGGLFSRANGAPATAFVALDPVTGATVPAWNLLIENRRVGGVLHIRDLDVNGAHLYLAGSFTHVTGVDQAQAAYMRDLGRVLLASSAVERDWNPELNGTAMAIDGSDDGTRVYAAGYFTRSQGAAAENAAAVTTDPGAALATPTWAPVWSASNSYQQGIAEVGARVWVGGSEHSLFGFSTQTFERLNTDIMNAKGDLQVVLGDRGVVYAGCHCNHYSYSGATTWPNVGSSWHQADAMRWVGAWSADTGQRIPHFTPRLRMRLGSGVWALLTDSNGRLWIGGDLEAAATPQGEGDWAGGFTRFSLRDTTPPATPGGFRVVSQTEDTVTLAWSGGSDPSGTRYQVLREDRPVVTTTTTSATVPRAGGTRFFVRSADGAGNVSPSTPVLLVEGGATPPDDTPVSATVVPWEAEWRWRYDAEAPPADWAQPGFDASGWALGGAVLGFGADSVVTDIDGFSDPADRPRAAYFRHEFVLEDPTAVESVTLTGVANDGAVFYVNGVEVARQNMPDGQITHLTFASTARREAVAKADPVVVTVPAELLLAGTNVLAAQTHLKYRGTPDVTFEAELRAP